MHRSFPHHHKKSNSIRLTGEDTFQNVRKTGLRTKHFHDVYHQFLTMRWTIFFILIASIYVLINMAFGLFYSLIPSGVTGVPSHHFWRNFFFSVHTLSTVGYGNLAPVGMLANAIVTLETFIGIIFTGLVTGLIFARFSSPHALVLFSDKATIATHKGKTLLNLRIGNLRRTALIDLTVEAILVRRISDMNGEPTLQLERIPLKSAHLPILPITWVISHEITQDSPLYGLSKDDLLQQKAEIIVTLSATDQASAQTAFAMHTYAAEHIKWGCVLREIMRPHPDGSVVADFSLFHATTTVPTSSTPPHN